MRGFLLRSVAVKFHPAESNARPLTLTLPPEYRGEGTGKMAVMNDFGIAPADAIVRTPWPTWKKITAYAIMSLLSLAAIVVVDVKVHRTAVMPTQTSPNPR